MDLSINIPNGKYVVAVSGGVDSVTLLDLLAKQKVISESLLNGSAPTK